MLDSKAELLGNLPIFRGLTRKELGSIIDAATKTFFDEAAYLITRNEPGHTAFFILTGSARCLSFPGVSIAGGPIGPGTLLGEMAMLVDTVHTFSIQAVERVRALAIHREALKRVMLQEPAIAKQISDNLLERLQSFARDLRRLDAVLAQAELGRSETPVQLEAYGTQSPAIPPLAQASPVDWLQKQYKYG